jgi:hypothetical protein
MFSSSKVKISHKFVWGQTALAGSKCKKFVGTSNQPIRTKNFQKFVRGLRDGICRRNPEHQIYQSVPEKCKGAKNSYGGYPTEFAPGA